MPPLSPKMIIVINALIAGLSDKQAAQQAGVCPCVIKKWRCCNRAFRMAYQALLQK